MRKPGKESSIEDEKERSLSDDPNPEIGASVRANDPVLEINMHGTGLTKEALDCFVYMIVQCLWHLREFTEEFTDRIKSHHNHINSPCIVCALKEVFDSLREREAVATASLRNALIVHYHEKTYSSNGKMDNASEFLTIILESLHDSLITDLKLQKEASKDCFLVDCYVHRIFGMDHHQRINCVQCKVESLHQMYSSLYLSLSADNLKRKKDKHGEKSFDELLKLEVNRQWFCEACGKVNDIYHVLGCLPPAFTIALGWKKDDESSEDISRTFSTLSPDLDLNVLFEGWEPHSKYFLISMVCFYGAREQYTCFIYKHELEEYVQYNERNVEVIGSWREVVDTCVEECRQPTILFFLQKAEM